VQTVEWMRPDPAVIRRARDTESGNDPADVIMHGLWPVTRTVAVRAGDDCPPTRDLRNLTCRGPRGVVEARVTSMPLRHTQVPGISASFGERIMRKQSPFSCDNASTDAAPGRD